MTETNKTFNQRYCELQNELKAPKNQFNEYGDFKYRSCEDILEALKPLTLKYGMALTVHDEIEEHGGNIYIKAVARLQDSKKDLGQMVEGVAYAREAQTKKGMDDSQITGAASSYARKYALNGLFLIDDTKDADTCEYTKKTQEQTVSKAKKIVDSSDFETIKKIYKEYNGSPSLKRLIELYTKKGGVNRKISDLSATEQNELSEILKGSLETFKDEMGK